MRSLPKGHCKGRIIILVQATNTKAIPFLLQWIPHAVSGEAEGSWAAGQVKGVSGGSRAGAHSGNAGSFEEL